MKLAGVWRSRLAAITVLATVLLGGFVLGRGWHPSAPAVGPVTASSQPLAAAKAPVFAPETAPSFESALKETATDYGRRLHLAQDAAALDRAGVIAALERARVDFLKTRGTSQQDDLFPVEALLARLADLDPPAAATWVMEARDRDNLAGAAWLEAALGKWVAHDPAAALAWSRGWRQSSLYHDMISELFAQWAAVDPKTALQQLPPDLTSDVSLWSRVFQEVAKKDLPFARTRALQLPPSLIASAAVSVADVWARSGDPAEAYAWVSRLTVRRARSQALSSLYEAWSERDPAAAAACMLEHGGPDLSEHADEVALAWVVRDPAAALTWCERLPAWASRDDVVKAAISSWSEVDPRNAADFTLALPKEAQGDCLAPVISNWAQLDHKAAFAWSNALPSGELRQKALQEVCLGWNDHRACADYLVQQPDQAAFQDTFSGVIDSWAQIAPQELWQWSATLSDPKQRTQAAAAALAQIASSDPPAAGVLFAQLPGNAQKVAVQDLADTWVKTNPDAAAQWVGSLPAGPVQNKAVAAVVSGWASSDVPATIAWINSQPPGALTDAAVASLLNVGDVHVPPADSIPLASRMQSAAKRADAFESIALDWLQQDRPAATEWIKQSEELSPDKRARLLATGEAAAGQ